MQFNVITIFPEMIRAALKEGVVGQAVQHGLVKLDVVSPRQFTADFHKTVDDRPFGGGDGMVMLYSPMKAALDSFAENKGKVVLLSAQGEKWSDSKARLWSKSGQPVTLICGRYGGVDQRFINECVDEEISVGDYILSGGELAALILIDSTARLLPEVLGNMQSADKDSFADGLLEAPLFTRPQAVAGQKVPTVFLSGDHKKIDQARRALSILITLKKRPELVSEVHRLELRKHKYLLNEFSEDDWAACGLGANQVKGFYDEI